jgi:hypothetical protein
VTLLIDLLAPHLQPHYLQSDHPTPGKKETNKQRKVGEKKNKNNNKQSQSETMFVWLFFTWQ